MANINLSNAQLHNIEQSRGYLGRLLRPLLKTRWPVIGNLLKQLVKSVLISLGLTAAASVTDAAIHKKVFGSGNTTLIIYNEEINDIMKIVKSLEESGYWKRRYQNNWKWQKNKQTNKQKRGFHGMLLSTLGASFLGILVAGKGTIRAGEGTIRPGQDFW